jgi:hypothetical protein
MAEAEPEDICLVGLGLIALTRLRPDRDRAGLERTWPPPTAFSRRG